MGRRVVNLTVDLDSANLFSEEVQELIRAEIRESLRETLKDEVEKAVASYLEGGKVLENIIKDVSQKKISYAVSDWSTSKEIQKKVSEILTSEAQRRMSTFSNPDLTALIERALHKEIEGSLKSKLSSALKELFEYKS
jgi:predicted house-cleaning noncanonical NTP pyrophosphatase (MazG superfamily)